MKQEKRFKIDGEEEGWIAVPRTLAGKRRNGSLSLPQFRVLTWLFCIADPYGKAYVTFASIAEDAFDGTVTKAWTNIIMNELKSMRYIWYETRSGKRGSFEVRIDGFMRSDGEKLSVEKYINLKALTDQTVPQNTEEFEAKQESQSESWRLQDAYALMNADESSVSKMDEIGGYKNDNQNNNKNENKNITDPAKKMLEGMNDNAPIKKVIERKSS